MASTIVTRCAQALIEKKLTIAFAESATAGRMSYEFSTVKDVGQALMGGIVSYHIRMKEEVLGIPHGLIETFTPESAEVTREMAQNLSRMAGADICVAVTGLTTPGGSETPEKPVGTMFLHLILFQKHWSKRCLFSGTPEAIVLQTIDEAALLILNEINQK